MRAHLQGGHTPAREVLPPPDAAAVGLGDDADFAPPSSAAAATTPVVVSPDQVTWLSVAVVTHAATRYVAVLPHPAFSPPEQRTVPWRVDNHTSCHRLLIRQRGLGPAASETVPAYGSHGVIPFPLQLDRPSDGGSGFLLQARPVGVPSLYYWAGGQVGRAVARRDFAAAAEALATCALGGHVGGQGLRSRTNNSFGVWGWADGAATVPMDDVGADITVPVGRARGGPGGGAVRRARLRVRVYSDASTGPCNVIHVTDAPPGSEEASAATSVASTGSGEGSHQAAVDFLLASLRTAGCYERQGVALLTAVDAQLAQHASALRGGLGEDVTGAAAAASVEVEPLGPPLSAAALPPVVLTHQQPRAFAPLPPSPTAAPTVAASAAAPSSSFLGSLGGAVTAVATTTVGAVGSAAGAAVGAAGAVGGAAIGAVGSVTRLTGLRAGAAPLTAAGQDVLWLQVVSAANLAISDVVGLSDPFCVVQLESFNAAAVSAAATGDAAPSSQPAAVQPSPALSHVLETVRTPVCRGTLHPVWGSEHVLQLGARPIVNALAGGLALQLRVLVYDWGP